MDNFSKFINFLLGKKYTLVEDNEQLQIVTYKLDGLFVQIEQEVNLERFISLSRKNNHSWEGWYDMGIIRFFILQRHFKANEVFKFDELSQFFIDHYEEIIEAFSSHNFAKTEVALTILQNERAKALYGD